MPVLGMRNVLEPASAPGLVPLIGSIGVLNPGYEMRLTTEDGEEIEIVKGVESESGELWLKGQTIVLGYIGDEVATRETFAAGPSGWLRTGDIG